MRCAAATSLFLLTLSATPLASAADCSPPSSGPVLSVVATLPDYAVITRAIGGERVSVQAIVQGDQDAHFIRPKPSFVEMVNQADMLVATGLDLELWLPTVVDKSGNVRVRSGRPGYVATSRGVDLLEVPANISRSEGGVHVYGNPHVTCSPLNVKTAARNITIGLVKNDPDGKECYEANLEAFLKEIDRRLFGPELVELLGSETLFSMAEKGTLLPFLEKQQFRGKPLIDSLGGWMKRMLPLRGMEIVTYHKNWVYFLTLFSLKEAGTVEPKPGIPPSPRHVTELVDLMRVRKIRIILAANYFDEQKVRTVARRVDAVPVIVPLYVGGEEGVDDYFQLVDLWTERMTEAAVAVGKTPALLSASLPETGS
ncbi:MAG: metal ABC transporter substrate-binding protein [Acidobacteria bacterium]|jgi:ABC-type Zn uptake system ZnuABC Zn-binding protein ZnuA|nr:metal ABC transporter substrate-binding protein [Acidobacteriota bacterium]